jgi:hypothetical protein
VPDEPFVNSFDPLQLLAAIDPVEESSLVETGDYEPAQTLLAGLLAGEGSLVTLLPSRRDRRRRRMAAGGVAIVMACSAAAAWVVTRPADNPLDVACYAQPALRGEVAGVTPHGTNPIDACANVWRTGAFAGRGAVPPLVGCVTRRGSAAVFPSESPTLCDTLGLDRLGDAAASDQTILGLQDVLTDTFLSRGCVTPDEAMTLVRSELDRRGLTEWRINNPGPYPPNRPCASLSFDVPARSVTLVPFPARPPSPTTTAPTGGTRP